MRYARNQTEETNKKEKYEGSVGRSAYRVRKRGNGDTLTALRSTLQETLNSNKSESAMTALAKSIGDKRSVTRVGSQTID